MISIACVTYENIVSNSLLSEKNVQNHLNNNVGLLNCHFLNVKNRDQKLSMQQSVTLAIFVKYRN